MSKSKWKWKEFSKLRTSNDMEDYLLNREYEHTRYFHYTTLETVRNILKGNQFWIVVIPLAQPVQVRFMGLYSWYNRAMITKGGGNYGKMKSISTGHVFEF